MKKFVLFFCVLLFISFLFAEDFMKPSNNKIPVYGQKNSPRVLERSRVVPDWEFITEPASLIASYYDYMPGSYNSLPIQIQPDEDGIYIVFHGRETASSTRRIYYVYIDGEGNILNVSTIGTDDIHEGYAGIDIDPVTADPMVAWHQDYIGGPIAHYCLFSYDLYHVLGGAGLWITPFVIIDDTIPTPFADDDFIWPYVHIGPSPEAGKRRVYITAMNFVSHQPSGNPSENELLGYADFNVEDLNIQSQLDWTWNTLPVLDGWNQGDPEEVRPNHSFAVSEDGQVVYMGYSIAYDSASPTGDQFYVLYNDNYGIGDFEFISVSAEYDIENPQNLDGTYRFTDETTGIPHDLFMEPYLCNHMNTIFTNDDTKIRFLGNMNMMIRPNQWYPEYLLMYLKLYTYDIATQEFSFMDFVDLPGVNPTDNTPVLPWDINEDGLVDGYDPEGLVTWVPGHPIYFHASDVMFHENTTKLTKNNEKHWLAAIWLDGVKNRLAVQGDPNYIGWENYAEIMIAISADNGENWSEPIIMNAKVGDDNYVLQLDGIMPCYIYPADKIIDLGDNRGKLDILFYDDNSFGSYSNPTPYGANEGGTLTYMSLDLDFSELPSSTQYIQITPTIAKLYQNYPNPFNPCTTIKYTLKEATDITINVYNIKGQKVKTLVAEYQHPGMHKVEWNGTDLSNKSVSSGVYFYDINLGNGDYTSVKKMLLLK